MNQPVENYGDGHSNGLKPWYGERWQEERIGIVPVN
jgi:hypothetical protein